MNPTFPKTAFRYLLTSVTLTFLSALLAFVMAAIVPFRIGPDLSQPIQRLLRQETQDQTVLSRR